jgi:hypothetical protein
MVAYWVASLLEWAAGRSGQGTVETVIDGLVIVLFLFLMVRIFLRKGTR